MDIENKLRQKMIHRRIIEALIGVVFLIIGIVCAVLLEKSKMVETIGVGWLNYEKIYYTKQYLNVPKIIGFGGFVMSCGTIFIDFIKGGIDSVQTNSDRIIIYKGFVAHILYINEKEADRLFVGRSYLKGKLSDGVTVTASYQFFNSYHLTFSDNRSEIDT